MHLHCHPHWPFDCQKEASCWDSGEVHLDGQLLRTVILLLNLGPGEYNGWPATSLSLKCASAMVYATPTLLPCDRFVPVDKAPMMASPGKGTLPLQYGHELRADNQHQSLKRRRIVLESRLHAKQRAQRDRQPYFKAPDYPGTAAFDLRTGLGELPRAQRRKMPTVHEEPTNVCQNAAMPEVVEGAEDWTSEEHYDHMMRELDSLEQASRSSSPTQPSPYSDGNINISSSSSLTHNQCDCIVSCPSSVLATTDCTVCTRSKICLTSRASDHADHAHAIKSSHKESSPTVSQGSTTFLEGPLIMQPISRPINEQQLIAEVKDIYAGLVMVEKKCVEIVTNVSRSYKPRVDMQREAFVKLHRALLREHHDFFSASQHPVASDALKRLAIKYAMPARLWKFGIQPALDILEFRASGNDYSTASFVQFAHEMLQSLQTDFPVYAGEWELLKYNLREYFLVLESEGVDVPSSFIDDWTSTYSASSWEMREKCPPLTGQFFGDDELLDCWIQANVYAPDKPPRVTGSFANTQTLHLTETAARLMSGWLHYGRKIAPSFHSFAHVFIYLGLVGATTALFQREGVIRE